MPKVLVEYADGRPNYSEVVSDLGPFVKRQFELGAETLTMGFGRFDIATAMCIPLPAWPVKFVGLGKGTRLRGIATKAATMTVPAHTGFPGSRECLTQVLGLYFTAQNGMCPHLTYGNFTLEGVASTPAVAGHYKFMRAIAAEIVVEPIWADNKESLVHDSTFGIQSPYKTASQRGFTNLVLQAFGQDIWEEPDTKRCRPISRVIVKKGGTMNGEPFYERVSKVSVISEVGVGAVSAFEFRNCGPITWETGINFGGSCQTRSKLCSDLVLGGVPNEDDTFIVATEDPFTRAIISQTITWKAVPTLASHALLGADAGACALNAVTPIMATRKGYGGSHYAEALKPSQFFPVDPNNPTALDGVAARIRIQARSTPDGNLAPAPQCEYFAPGAVSVVAGVNTAGMQLVVPIYTGTSANGSSSDFDTRGRWLDCVTLIDCWGGIIGSSDIGREDFVGDVIRATCTTDNVSGAGAFIPNPNGERGHRWFTPWTGETNAMRCGLRLQDAGWGVVNGPMFGLSILTGTKGMVTIEPGTHREFRLAISGAGPSDAEIFTLVNDGHGGTKVFEFNTGAAGAITPGRVEITTTTPQATMEAIRQALFVLRDAHTHTISPGIVIDDGGGAFHLDVICFTEREYSALSSWSEGASNFTITDISNPMKPRYSNVNLHHHALGNDVFSSVPSFWGEDFVDKCSITGIIDTARANTQLFQANSPWAASALGFNAVPLDGETIVLNSINADGDQGAAITFHFKAGGDVDTATTKYINTTGGTNESMARAFTEAVYAAQFDTAFTKLRSFGAGYAGELDPGLFPGVHFVYTWDGTRGSNAGFCTVTSAGAILELPLADGTGNGQVYGKKLPIVGINCRHLDVSGITASENTPFIVPMPLVYFEKLAGPSKATVNIGGNRLLGRWGQGGFDKNALVLAGPNASMGDVLSAGDNFIDGVRKV